MCSQISMALGEKEAATSLSQPTISREKIFIENTNRYVASKKQVILDYIKNNNITNLYLFSEDKIIVKDNQENIIKQFYLLDYKTIYLLSKKKKFHLYENYEANEKVKLFIDIDIKLDNNNIENKDEYFDEIIDKSIKLFIDELKKYDIKDPEIIILKSSSNNKLSSHIIFNDVIFEDIYHMKQFFGNLKSDLIENKIIDENKTGHLNPYMIIKLWK